MLKIVLWHLYSTASCTAAWNFLCSAMSPIGLTFFEVWLWLQTLRRSTQSASKLRSTAVSTAALGKFNLRRVELGFGNSSKIAKYICAVMQEKVDTLRTFLLGLMMDLWTYDRILENNNYPTFLLLNESLRVTTRLCTYQ